MDDWTDLDQAYLNIFGHHPDDLRPRAPVPEQEYLAMVGEFAFWVSNLEWDIVADIRVATAEVDVIPLLGRSTGQIGRALSAAADGLAELQGDAARPNVEHFLRTGSRALLDVAQRRNHVMHARPAQRADGSVCLLRLREVAGNPQRIWIDEAFLARQIKVVHYWTRRVKVARAMLID